MIVQHHADITSGRIDRLMKMMKNKAMNRSSIIAVSMWLSKMKLKPKTNGRKSCAVMSFPFSLEYIRNIPRKTSGIKAIAVYSPTAARTKIFISLYEHSV